MTSYPHPTPLIVGLGCSSSADAGEIVSLIAACLAEAGRDVAHVAALATHSRKRGSLALIQAAAYYDLPLRFLDDDDLAMGHPGTCEAVAAAAGSLLLGKRKSAYATCAIAEAAPDFSLSAFGQPGRSSAMMASSTLATSLAGP